MKLTVDSPYKSERTVHDVEQAVIHETQCLWHGTGQIECLQTELDETRKFVARVVEELIYAHGLKAAALERIFLRHRVEK